MNMSNTEKNAMEMEEVDAFDEYEVVETEEVDTFDEYEAAEIEKVRMFSEKIVKVREELAKDVVGQSGIIDNVIIAIVAGGNVLLEGVPGVGKTRLVRSLGKVLSLPFSRIVILSPSRLTIVHSDPDPILELITDFDCWLNI